MADLSITAIELVATGTLRTSKAASEAFDVGDAMYLSGSNYALADATDTAKLSVVGIALFAGGSGDYPILAADGARLRLTGPTLTKGAMYYLSTTGHICPFADLTTGDSVIPLLLAESTSVVEVKIIVPTATITL